jgi:WD40 repeat protein
MYLCVVSCTFVFVCMVYVLMEACACACVCTVCACMFVYVFVCVYVRVHVLAHVCIQTHSSKALIVIQDQDHPPEINAAQQPHNTCVYGCRDCQSAPLSMDAVIANWHHSRIIFLCVYACVFACAKLQVRMYVSIFVMHVCLNVCMHTFMRCDICIHAYMYISYASACAQAATSPHATLEGHQRSALCIAISGDCTFIASGSVDRTIKLWDIQKHVCMCTITGTNAFWAIDLSKDGAYLASCGRTSIMVWTLLSNRDLQNVTENQVVPTPAEEPRLLIGHSSDVRGVKMSRDSARIVSCCDDGTVRVWNVQTGELLQTLQGHKGGARSLAWSPDSRLVASAGFDDKTVRVWDMIGGTQVMQPLGGHGNAVMCVVWGISTASLVVSCDLDTTITVWDLQGSSARVRHRLRGHAGFVRSVALSPDDRFIVSGGDDKTVRVWGVAAGRLVKVLEGHTCWVVSVAWARDSRHIVSGGNDHTVRVWEVDEQVCVRVRGLH